MQSLKDFWIAARRTATPLVVIESHDEIATQKILTQYANEETINGQVVPSPIWRWDCVQGYRAGNVLGHECESALEGIDQIEDALSEVASEDRIPQRSVLLYQWRSEFWQSPM